MRSVCFVDHLEFEFTGSIFKNALAMGDIDNDGEIELVIGNINGELDIFKHDKCWQKINNLGMIAAIGVGDIMNCGSNALVVVCSDGWCHICLCLHPKTEDNEDITKNVKLEPVHVQRIPPNAKFLGRLMSVLANCKSLKRSDTSKCNIRKRVTSQATALILEDVDGDGSIELVLGLTDRVVRLYRWVQSATGGRLVCLFKWECANQIGGLALSQSSENLPKILVAQPGGTVMKINPETSSFQDTEGDQVQRNEVDLSSSVEYLPLMVSKMRNPNISTEIVGNISDGNINGITSFENFPEALSSCKEMSIQDNNIKIKGKPYAVATLDGTLMLIREEEIIWSYQVDQQLFALSKLDVTGDGKEEIIACSWDGQTYIIDHDKNAVGFHVEEPVSAFCAGLYTLKPDSPPTPCFVYITFSNKILLYPRIEIPSMVCNNFLSLIIESEEIVSLVGEDVVNDRSKLCKLVSKCLYGIPQRKTNWIFD